MCKKYLSLGKNKQLVKRTARICLVLAIVASLAASHSFAFSDVDDRSGIKLIEVTPCEQEMLEKYCDENEKSTLENEDTFNSIIGIEDNYSVNVKPAVEITEESVKNALNDYFSIRHSSLTQEKSDSQKIKKQFLSCIEPSNKELRSLEIRRVDMRGALERLYDIEVTDAEVYTNVEEFKELPDSEGRKQYSADVYEWTWIYYTSEGSDLVDRMGYGISHEMTFAKDDNNVVTITRDEFDDTYIFDYNDCGEALEDRFFDISTKNRENYSCDERSILRVNTGNWKLNKIIRYADKYVKHDIAINEKTNHVAYYNMEQYTYGIGNDCANYVSQCIHAGGEPMTNTWQHDSANESGDVEHHSTYGWCTVAGIADEFVGGLSYLTTIADNETNVCPGNPVVTNNYGHIAICVGYNSN